MAHNGPDVCEIQLNGVSEAMDLLQIDVEADVVEGRPGKQDATCSVSCFCIGSKKTDKDIIQYQLK